MTSHTTGQSVSRRPLSIWDPKPYFVTAAGLRLLRKSLADRGNEWTPFTQDRNRTPGQSFPRVWHELATTEFLLSVWEAAKRRSDLELLLTGRRSLANHPAFRVSIVGRPVHLQPDAFFLVRQSARGMTCCLLETDAGTESERQLAAKLERYRVWSESAVSRDYLCETYRRFGAMSPAPLFRLVLVICGITTRAPDLRLALLLRLLRTQPHWFRQRVWAATANAFQLATDVSLAPVWVRGRDIRTEFEEQLSNVVS